MTAETPGQESINAEVEGVAAERRRALKRLGLTAGATAPLRLRDGLRVEDLDGELVVLDASGETVHRVTGDGVAAVRLLEQGVGEHDVPSELSDALDSLIEAGLVSGRNAVSRRAAMAAGGAGALAAATVTTFALADPAAAWSTCRNGKTPTPNDSGSTGKKYTTAGTHTWTSGPSGFHTPNTQRSYNIIVRAWGGGGGGGDDGCTWGGGGGGGGAYVDATIPVLECTEYTVTVGAGGTRNNNGFASSFKDDATLKADFGRAGTNGCTNGGPGGAGGSITNSAPASGNRRAGGSGGNGGGYSDTATGGGSGGSTGNGGNGNSSTRGAAGSGNPGGAQGGDDESGQRNGLSPGGGGAGDGGNGAPGAVWIGV